ncbi:MAG: hypothetical protein IPI65_11020 [Bacteroidetes bacterium]|nr:hypothetical protein [Bacteroidota bacterium]
MLVSKVSAGRLFSASKSAFVLSAKTLCATKMKQTLFILTILIYSCSTKQSKQFENTDSIISMTKPMSIYDSFTSTACEHLNLSEQFDIKVNFERHTNSKEHHDSCIVKLFLTDKTTKKVIDNISVSSHFYFRDVFMNCKNVISYSTKINLDKEVVDNYYGDLIVADLNFDNKDDIAVINDSGGNGGTFYSYYLQGIDNKFTLNKFLTDSMTYFPSKIKNKSNTLITYVPAGVCGLGEHIYQLNIRTNTWKQKSHKIIDICNE